MKQVSRESAFFALWGALFAVALAFSVEFMAPGLPVAFAETFAENAYETASRMPEQMVAAVGSPFISNFSVEARVSADTVSTKNGWTYVPPPPLSGIGGGEVGTPSRPKCSVAVSVPAIRLGKTAVLTWTSPNAVSMQLTNNLTDEITTHPPSGTLIISPERSTTYTSVFLGKDGHSAICATRIAVRR